MTARRKLWILVIVRRHHRVQVSAFIMPTSYLQEHSLVMFLEMKADGEALYRAHPVLRRLAACDLQNPWEQALKWVWSLLTVIDASRELWMQTTLLVLITDTSGCKTRCQLFVEGGEKKDVVWLRAWSRRDEGTHEKKLRRRSFSQNTAQLCRRTSVEQIRVFVLKADLSLMLKKRAAGMRLKIGHLQSQMIHWISPTNLQSVQQ